MPIAVLSSFLFQFLWVRGELRAGAESGLRWSFNWIISNFACQTKSAEVNELNKWY